MITLCQEAGLPEPDYELRQGSFVLTLWRDWLTDAVLAGLEINERQRQALTYLKTHRTISNTAYQQVAKAIKKTATRDLNDLRKKGIIEQRGSRGPGVHYVLAKGVRKGTLGT